MWSATTSPSARQVVLAIVLHAERFVAACRDRIHHPDLRRLPLVGAVDQFVDSTDVLSHRHRPRRLRAIFDRE